MHYTKLVLYCCVLSSGYIITSSASTHEIPSIDNKITLKEHLQKAAKQLKKIPVTQCAYHASLKNYNDDEFETALENFKRKCIIHSLEQEDKRTINQEMEYINYILECSYTCLITQNVPINRYIRIVQNEHAIAECHYLGLHSLTESIHVLDYYTKLAQMLNLYYYFPASYVTKIIYIQMVTIEEDLVSKISAHLMEHVRHNMLCFLSLLGCLSRQYHYFDDKLINKLSQILHWHKKLIIFCYILHKPEAPNSSNKPR